MIGFSVTFRRSTDNIYSIRQQSTFFDVTNWAEQQRDLIILKSGCILFVAMLTGSSESSLAD